MSSEQNNPPTDQQIQQLYASLSQPLPPAELDRSILEAAHKSVSPQVSRLQQKRRNWYVPVSMAAVVLISFSVVLKLVIDEAALQPAAEMSAQPEPVIQASPATALDNASAPAASLSGAPVGSAPQAESVAAPAGRTQSLSIQENRRTEDEVLQKQFREKSAKRYSPQAVVPERLQSAQSLVSDELKQKATAQPQQEAIEARIKYLMDLLETRQFDKLQAELAAFRQQHADYPLPDRLIEWSSNRLGSPD